MTVLRLREFDRIHCGSAFSPEERTVTERQMVELERVSERFRVEKRATIFVHGPRRSLVAQNYVGVINLGAHQVEILPKIEGDVSQVRHNLARMVATTLRLALHSDNQTQVDRVDQTVLDAMARLFCDELWKAVRQGLIRRYETHEDNLVVLRGRLNVNQQIRYNLARPDRLHCTFDEFTADNPLNRALRLALQLLLKVVRSFRASRSLSELLFCFQDVGDVTPGAINWEQVQTNRLSQRYAPLVRMARLFIEGASPDLVSGRGDGFSILFDMNELFEEYIGRVAMKVFAREGLPVRLQAPKRHLAQSESGVEAFELRPDVVVGADDRPHFIIDTKWKRLQEEASREAVSSADMYQMLAYGYRYDCSDVVLLYPHHARLKAWVARRATYAVEGRGDERVARAIRVSVATVDLADLASVPGQLRQIFIEAPLASAA
jgi:5-methylcytosine-specific restriction enzyme subunit McrC